MPEDEPKLLFGVLDPLERISEVLFGVIMALTFTCTLGVATADNIQVKTMLIGALGCNLAWGVIDAGVYLIARVNLSGRKILMLRAMRAAADRGAARRILADALPPLLVSALSEAQVDEMRQLLQKIPHDAARPHLTSGDWLGALGVCLLCFLFDISRGGTVPRVWRCQNGTARLQRGGGVSVVLLRVCVRIPQRLFLLGRWPVHGRFWGRDGRRRDRPWGLKRDGKMGLRKTLSLGTIDVGECQSRRLTSARGLCL